MRLDGRCAINLPHARRHAEVGVVAQLLEHEIGDIGALVTRIVARPLAGTVTLIVDDFSTNQKITAKKPCPNP